MDKFQSRYGIALNAIDPNEPSGLRGAVYMLLYRELDGLGYVIDKAKPYTLQIKGNAGVCTVVVEPNKIRFVWILNTAKRDIVRKEIPFDEKNYLSAIKRARLPLATIAVQM